MRIMLTIALLLPIAAVAQTSPPPTNAVSGSGTPIGPPPVPAVPPPSNQTVGAAPRGTTAPPTTPAAALPEPNTSIPEK